MNNSDAISHQPSAISHPRRQTSIIMFDQPQQWFTLCLLLLLFGLPLLFFLVRKKPDASSSPGSQGLRLKPYPIIGSSLDVLANLDRRIQWTSDLIRASPSATVVLHRSLGSRAVLTGNPANVQHILKTHFHNYHKGRTFTSTFSDFLGDGIFNADADTWKFQRQVSSHEFNTKSLRKFVETVVETELSHRLLPVLTAAAAGNSVLDFQDILQRFAFDNICKIAFGYDPALLLPSLPHSEFAIAFEEAARISSQRFASITPLLWKLKRLLGIGSERRLKLAVARVRDFAKNIVSEKKRDSSSGTDSSTDLLSRFLASGHSDDDFVTDIVISFILAGRDTTSAALTWFFWLLFKHPQVEDQILSEINDKSEFPAFDEVKDMVYTHAALCESMRFYPPVPADSKEAVSDDVLPDGTEVKKGNRVTYHPYAMGRLEELWGSDWPEYRPDRWLERDSVSGKWSFVGRDSYTYPVFQAGPRICLGKEMAFLQMKRVVAGVLRRFRVLPVTEDGGAEPVLTVDLAAKMKGGFPVRIVERNLK